MSTSVVKSLNTNMIGVVTSGNYATVLDATDLTAKADKSYVSQLESKINGVIKKESEDRISSEDSIRENIKSLDSALLNKADKDTVQKIVSELALRKIKADLDAILIQHIKNIQEACLKEHTTIENDIKGFRDFADNANNEATAMLQPIYDNFRKLNARLDTITTGISTVDAFQKKISDFETKLEYSERKSRDVAESIRMNSLSLKKIVTDQINDSMIKIVKDVEEQIKFKKKSKGFFSRLFS